MKINLISDCPAARRLWETFIPDPDCLFDEWELRSALAHISGTVPRFLCADDENALLALGVLGDRTIFFGGSYFNERNKFYGSATYWPKLINFAAERFGKCRLLSWAHDPSPFINDTTRLIEVPFNQYWEITFPESFESYLERRSKKLRKRIRSFFRRGQIEILPLEHNPNITVEVIDIMEQHAHVLSRNGRRSVYEDEQFRQSLDEIHEFVIRNATLYGIFARQENGELAGFGTVAQSPKWRCAVYLTNFYRGDVGDASHMVLAGVIKLGLENGFQIDGMRGGFGLKPAYKFLPVPSYALVQDESWVVKPQTDLSEEELRLLYGRLPGEDALRRHSSCA